MSLCTSLCCSPSSPIHTPTKHVGQRSRNNPLILEDQLKRPLREGVRVNRKCSSPRSQPAPVQPAGQKHRPVILSHEPPFSHTHCWEQWWPYWPAAQAKTTRRKTGTDSSQHRRQILSVNVLSFFLMQNMCRTCMDMNIYGHGIWMARVEELASVRKKCV